MPFPSQERLDRAKIALELIFNEALAPPISTLLEHAEEINHHLNTIIRARASIANEKTRRVWNNKTFIGD